jgi:hypothetical protein
MMDEVVRLLQSTEGTVALVTSIISGALAGVGLATLHRTVTTPVRRAFVTGLVVLWLGVLYFVSLAVAVAVAGNPLPTFMYALGVVWAMFCAGVGLGSYVSFKLRNL